MVIFCIDLLLSVFLIMEKTNDNACLQWLLCGLRIDVGDDVPATEGGD